MNLTTKYLGLTLKHPLVSAAGPLAESVSTVRELEDAGAAAVVLHSLFEEQIRHEAEELDHFLAYGTESFAEALTYFPEAEEYKLGPEEYLAHISKLKEAVDIPIIASLNGATIGGWVEYAKQIEQAGADALELNIYLIAADPELSSTDLERRHLEILQVVRGTVKIPIAVKLSPFFSALASMARRLDEAGADGLVLFNRFYQPDIDLETLEVVPNLVLSNPFEMRLPLRWIAILYGHVGCSLAGNRGISTGEDVIKMVMAGADVAQVCSVLLREGVGRLTVMLSDAQRWMEEHEYESVAQMKGSMSQKACVDPTAFERANYVKTLQSYK
jgi:dihydroorotate dehydrogenase (fumarate)